MTKTLEELLRDLSPTPLTEGEIERGVLCLMGAVNCLLEMKIDNLQEDDYEPAAPKYKPVRIR